MTDKQRTVDEFFRCLNSLDWNSLEPLIAEVSALHDVSEIAVGRTQVTRRYRRWLSSINNLTIHVTDSASNEHTVFAETSILENATDSWNQMWAFHFDTAGRIDRIRAYRQ